MFLFLNLQVISAKTWKYKFISYPNNRSGYHFYNSEKGLIETRDTIVFFETIDIVIPCEQIKLPEDNKSFPTSHIKINDMDTNMEDETNPVSSTQSNENDQISRSKRKSEALQWLKRSLYFYI